MKHINNTRDLEFISSLSSLIDNHLDDDSLNVHDFANMFSITRLQLYRRIKNITGDSPSVFIRNQRLEKATVLLRTSNLSIADIATQVGFGSTKYFSTVFKNQFGLSPSNYIKILQESHEAQNSNYEPKAPSSNLSHLSFKKPTT